MNIFGTPILGNLHFTYGLYMDDVLVGLYIYTDYIYIYYIHMDYYGLQWFLMGYDVL